MVKRDYTSTVTDLKAMVRKEAEGDRRAQLTRDLDLMNGEIVRLRNKTDSIGALEAKVEGLTWLVRSVIVVAALEIIVGVIVAFVMKGSK